MLYTFIIYNNCFFITLLLGAGVPDVGVGMQDLQSPTAESQQHKPHSEGR
jgi:hypothetical protein